MSVILTFFIAAAVAIKFDKKIEECYALCALFLSFALYIPGLYFSFLPGVVLFWTIFIFSIIYFGWNLLKHRDKVSENIITPGAFFLLFCMLFLAIYCLNRNIDHSDDFYFWNLRIKNYVYFGKIKGVPNTEIGNHPPLSGLWDYLAVKTWIGGMSQGICLWAQDVLLLSLFAPVFTGVGKKNASIKTMLCTAIVLIIPTLDGNAYHTLLADVLLGALIFFCFYMFWKAVNQNDIFYAISFVVGMSSIVMAKRIGAAFFAIVFFVCCQSYNWIIKRKDRNMMYAAGIIAALSIYSWDGLSSSFYLVVAGILLGLLSGFLTQKIIGSKKKCQWILLLLLLFIVAVYITIGNGIMNRYSESNEHLQYVLDVITQYSQPSFIESVFDILVIGWLILRKRELVKKKISGVQMTVSCVSYAIGVAAYVLLILYLEITVIGPANEGLTGLNIRYFLPLLIPLYALALYSVLKLDFINPRILLVVMLLLLHAFSNEEKTNYFLINKIPALEFNEFRKNNITLKSTDHIYFIDENDGYGLADRAFYNFICPARSQFGETYNIITHAVGKEMDESLSELTDQIENGNFNYVYIQLITKRTAKEYEPLFESADDIGNGRLYEVIRDKNGVKLRWMPGDQK